MSGKPLQCPIPELQIVFPRGLASQLVFRVYKGSSQVAFAQLSRGSPVSRARHAPADGSGMPSISYNLKNIVVAQNYRGQGIGSTLLDEVLDYCRSHRVARIHGEITGDAVPLRRWYRRKGFHITVADEILLIF